MTELQMVGYVLLQTVDKFVYIFFEEIAQNFKEQGNDYFKGARYRDALGFYTQGIDAKPTDLVILEALLCNRAACNLKLGESWVCKYMIVCA